MEDTWWVDMELGRSGVGDPRLSGDKYEEKEFEGKVQWTRFDGREKKTVAAGEGFRITSAKAIQPKLANPNDLNIIEKMSAELQTKIVNGAELQMENTKSDILDDSNCQEYRSNRTKLHLIERMSGYASLNDMVGKSYFNPCGCFMSSDEKQAVQAKNFSKLEEEYQQRRRSSALSSFGTMNHDEQANYENLLKYKEEKEGIEHADQDIRTKETRLLFHEKKWQKRWLPLIMTHIEQFNKDFIEEAGKYFTKSLEVNPIYLSTLPPDTGPFKFRDPFSISLLPSTFV